MACSESDRLAALRSLGVLDTPRDEQLDALARSAAEFLQAPIALVSLVDEERQWFKARYGVETSETPRAWSFCAHAIAQDDDSVFVVPDATLDRRFTDNPLVTGEPGIRFYAGAALTDRRGCKLGALCVMDTRPRAAPDAAALDRLKLLARLVMTELEVLRRDQLMEELEAVAEMTETISGVATWKFDVQQQRFFGSPLAYAIHGVDPDTYAGDMGSTLALYAEEDRERVANLVTEALATGQGYQLQTRIIRPDGVSRDVLVKGECRRNARGDVAALVGVFQDITDQVVASRAMEDARRQADRLNWALEAFAASAAALNRFEDAASLFAKICETIVEGNRYPLAVVSLAEDDPDRTIRVVAAAGAARGYAETLDLSWDETKPTGQGPAGQTVRTGATIVGSDIISDEQFAPWRDKAAAFGLRSSATLLFRTQDHKAGILAVYADTPGSFSSAELDVFTKLASELSYALDLERNRQDLIESNRRRSLLIEELQASQRVISEALERANSANLAKSTFLANMSHELRTPLNGILGVAGALRLSSLDARQHEMVALIEDSARSLNLLLADILDWSKVEAGKLALHLSPFSVLRALKPTVDLMAIRAEEKGLDFVVELEGDVSRYLEGDALRINQILSNLLSNAVKFTDVGRVTVRLEVHVGPSSEATLVMRVQDTGAGFDETERARLFDRFEQLDSSITRRYGGTGLGLTIVGALVELMNGVVDVRSRPGFGSVFEVRLPLIAAEAPADQTDGEGDLFLPEGLRVLLAEDHPTNQKVVEIVLEPYGVDLTIVENGADAVAAWETGRFDLILMDMQMPVLDGLAAVRQIRATEQQRGGVYTAIAVLTANVGKDYVQASLDAGADGYIAKPVEPRSLIAGISRTLDSAVAKFETA